MLAFDPLVASHSAAQMLRRQVQTTGWMLDIESLSKVQPVAGHPYLDDLRASSSWYSLFLPDLVSTIGRVVRTISFPSSMTATWSLPSSRLNPIVRKCFRFLEKSESRPIGPSKGNKLFRKMSAEAGRCGQTPAVHLAHSLGVLQVTVAYQCRHFACAYGERNHGARA
jgi:hypothetical protein